MEELIVLISLRVLLLLLMWRLILQLTMANVANIDKIINNKLLDNRFFVVCGWTAAATE